MAATYNGPPRGGQPGGAWPLAQRPAAANVDRLLLDAFAAAGHAESARIERRVREFTLQFVAAPPSRFPAVVATGLDELCARSGADAAFAGLLELAPPALTLLVARGSAQRPVGPGDASGIDAGQASHDAAAAHAGLVRAAAAALAAGRPLEHPGNPAVPPSEATAAALRDAGLRSLRWVFRRVGADRAVVVAMHAVAEARYWSPACRLLQDGLADVLAAVVERTSPSSFVARRASAGSPRTPAASVSDVPRRKRRG